MLKNTYTPESQVVENLLLRLNWSSEAATVISACAKDLILKVREQKVSPAGHWLHYFLGQYKLSSPEGIKLMSLAESLLRIPDKATANDLLATVTKNHLLASLTMPIVKKAIRLIGKQFVIGESIEQAIKAIQPPYRYSFDMLGEAAKTMPQALDYFKAYEEAITALANVPDAGISVKLSALHPRYHYTQIERLEKELVPKIIELAALAKRCNVSMTIDAEEADRLQLSLLLIEPVLKSNELNNWNGFGLAVQAYQKAAPEVLDFCQDIAKKTQHRLMIRLVKGAYWDTEIKRAQEQGFSHYPVYTRKVTTDVSYLFCAQKLFAHPDVFYPQIATHNAHTVASILHFAKDNRDFEFQKLYGMGDRLFNVLLAQENVACRVYAPVGDYQHLLAYLVRRLLENGANSSFVHQIEDKHISVDELVNDPVATLRDLDIKENPKIPLPCDLYGAERLNSQGFDLSDFQTQNSVMRALHKDLKNLVTIASHKNEIDKIVHQSENAFSDWGNTSVLQRADYLNKAADLLAAHQLELMHIIIHEGKRTILDAQSEVREAIDYCRYYAIEAKKLMENPVELRGPTGETNTLSLHPRGITVCISPWNFPLAIFLGQIVAALVTGNTVIAKPASLTPQIAIRAVQLLHQAGIPKDVLQLAVGSSSEIGNALTLNPKIAQVVFTGSLETAQHIHQNLASRKSAIANFIAETSGLNAMIVDSSALLEQVVSDAITSAFNSAGQRCSALRIIFIQDEIYDACIEMLKGAMAELSIGEPGLLSTDVGPVIDNNSKEVLNQYILHMIKTQKLIYQMPLPDLPGAFVAPCLIEIDSIKSLTHEVFGPILHTVRYQYKHLDALIHDLNQTGYGLTLGVHSRNSSFANKIIAQTYVGNNYINRNMIGAVVGVQPFGGQRNSGTGPKAGGPHYLTRMVTEKTVTTNTAAIGGNAQLIDSI